MAAINALIPGIFYGHRKIIFSNQPTRACSDTAAAVYAQILINLNDCFQFVTVFHLFRISQLKEYKGDKP
jgi:hypothetical protein